MKHFDMKKIRRMELLAPAGSYECAKAAAAAGADAIYMGGPLFSARAYAESSKEDMLLRSIRYCHLRGVRVYMTLNTLMKDRELTDIEAYVRPYYEAGLDGVIVQDLGLLGFLRKHFPGLPLHASTQMTVTGPYFTRMLSDFGVTRVVPARELSLEEIKRISDTGIEVEVFSHGALCYAYSGQCLMSSCIGGRSGNRGRCAGPCRLPYDGSYILSMKDLNTLKLLPELWLARASSLKIEGRMKSPVYVAGVCSVYRKYLDRLYGLIRELEPEGEEGRKELLSAWNEKGPGKKDMEILSEIFDRGGSTSGYLEKQNGRDMLQIKERPGLRIRDEKIIEEISERYIRRERPVSISISARLVPGEVPKLRLSPDGEEAFSALYPEVFAEVTGQAPVQAAKNRAMTREEIAERLSKCGDSGFRVKKAEIDTSGEIFIPVGQLNELRRRGLSELEESMCSCFRGDRRAALGRT